MLTRLGVKVVVVLLAAAAVVGVSATSGSTLVGTHTAATAAVAPADVHAGTSGGVFALTVRNTGTTVVDVVRVTAPGPALSLRGGFAPGWAVVVAGGFVEFRGSLLPAEQAVLRVVADATRPSEDVTGTWGVAVSDDGFATATTAAGAENTTISLVNNVRVLRIETALTPAGADDGTATAGQAVDLVTSVVNEAGVSLDVGIGAPWGSAIASPGAPPPPVTLAPGERVGFTTSGVRLAGPGMAELRVEATSSAGRARNVAGRALLLEEATDFKSRSSALGNPSLVCDRAKADPGQPLQCSILVDKTAGPAGALSTATTFVLDDSDGGRYEARLVAPVTLAPGAVSQIRLAFESRDVPSGFNFGYYRPLIELRGEDVNGAAISRDRFAIDRLLVDFPGR